MVTLKWSLVFDKMTSLLQGCAVTMEISVLTLIFGTILGVVLALMRDSHIKVVSRLAQLYIWIWRGTPLMVQAFLIYFGLPNLGITFSAMTRRAFHVFKYRRIHCRNCPFRYPCY